MTSPFRNRIAQLLQPRIPIQPTLSQNLSTMFKPGGALEGYMKKNRSLMKEFETGNIDGKKSIYMYSTPVGNQMNAFVEDMLKQNEQRIKGFIDMKIDSATILKNDYDTYTALAENSQKYLLENPDKKQQTVYRGTSEVDPDTQTKVGDSFYTGKFYSTSSSKNLMSDMKEGKVVMEIQLKNYGTTLGNLTQYGEAEVLIPLGVQLVVKEIENVKGGGKIMKIEEK